MNTTAAFISKVRNRILFRLYMLIKLPAAYFSGLQVVAIDEEQCIVSVPFKWFSQNPFRSTYFACLAMAAEMSTGLLALAQIYQRKPQVSMLVVKLEATYHKKATAVTYFTCKAGAEMKAAIEKSIATGDAQTVIALAEGLDATGNAIASFQITWSFKKK